MNRVNMWYRERLKGQYEKVSDRARRSDRAALLTGKQYTEAEIARALFLRKESGYAQEIKINDIPLNANQFNDWIVSLQNVDPSTVQFEDVWDTPQQLTIKPLQKGVYEVISREGPLKNARAEWWGTAGNPLKDVDSKIPWQYFAWSGGNSKPT